MDTRERQQKKDQELVVGERQTEWANCDLAESISPIQNLRRLLSGDLTWRRESVALWEYLLISTTYGPLLYFITNFNQPWVFFQVKENKGISQWCSWNFIPLREWGTPKQQQYSRYLRAITIDFDGIDPLLGPALPLQEGTIFCEFLTAATEVSSLE